MRICQKQKKFNIFLKNQNLRTFLFIVIIFKRFNSQNFLNVFNIVTIIDAFQKKVKGNTVKIQQNILIDKKKSKNLFGNISKKSTIQVKNTYNKSFKDMKQLKKQKAHLDLKKSYTSSNIRKKQQGRTKINKKNDNLNLIKKKNYKQKKSLSITPQKSNKKSKIKLIIKPAKQSQKIDPKYQQYKRKITFTHQLPTQRILQNSLNKSKSFDKTKSRIQRSLTQNAKFKKQKIFEAQSKSKSQRKKIQKSQKKIKDQIATQNNNQITTIRKNHGIKKKFFIQLKTQYSEEKKQYFDQQYLKKIQIFNSQRYDSENQKKKHNSATKIQAYWKGYLLRRQLKKQFDKNIELNQSLLLNNKISAIYSQKEQNYFRQKESEYKVGQSKLNHLRKQIQIKDDFEENSDSIKTFSQKSSYYESQLQKIRRQQQQKWKKMIDVLRMIKNNDQNNEVIDRLIEESQQNRQNIKSIEIIKKQNRLIRETQAQQKMKRKKQFQQKKSKYDDKPLHIKKKKRISKQQIEKINQSYSKQYSNKKLLEEIQLCQYNQNQLNNQSPIILFMEASQKQNKNLQQISLGSSIKKIKISKYLNEAKKIDGKEIEVKEKNTIVDIQTLNNQQYINLQIKMNNKVEQLTMTEQNSQIVEKNMKKQIISEQIFNLMIYQLLQIFKQNTTILHKFLTYFNQFFIKTNQPTIYQNQTGECQPIVCNNNFIMDLNTLFIDYLQNDAQQLSNFYQNIIIPFGQKPQNILKMLRNDDDQQNNSLLVLEKLMNQSRQQQATQEVQLMENKFKPIIQIEFFKQFLTVLNNKLNIIGSQSQYYFNSCIIDSLNQFFDQKRPFGIKGLPVLSFKKNFKPPKMQVIKKEIQAYYNLMINLEIGKILNQDILDAQEINKNEEKKFKLLDKFVIQESQNDWNDINDLQFEVKYDVADQLIDIILSEILFEMINEGMV